MGATLIIVPGTCGVPELALFDSLRVVVLDDVVMTGFAGVYFRRLYVQAVLNPALRAEYELRRRQYLVRYLAEKEFAGDVVFVGTRATDVDLMEFSAVYAVSVSDKGLRAMSRLVYGDPVMLYMDFHGVLAAVEQAVDETFVVAEWAEVPLLVMRRFPTRVEVDVVLSAVRQRAILSEVLAGDESAQVWLEDAVFRSGTEKRTMFLADYDYLSFVRPVWRDAVVRMLGKAPSVVEVFRLPWCLVDTGALTTLCYRLDVNGRPTATARGYSLIDFVQTRLAGSLTAREMIGTWVGGLLCDDLTAVDTIASLGGRSLAMPGDVGLPSSSFSRGNSVHVPVEYAWMYSAVSGIVVREWEGEREIDGMPRIVADTLTSTWAPSLLLAELYRATVTDEVMSVCVVQFFSRLHSIGADIEFIARMCTHARAITVEGCRRDNFHTVLTPMLPGYNYLCAFTTVARLTAVQVLGCCPSLTAVMSYVGGLVAVDPGASLEELCAEISRLLIFSGRSLPARDLVGHAVPTAKRSRAKHKQGYCYECLFQPRYRARAKLLLQAYPTLQSLIHPDVMRWYVEDAVDVVMVTQGRFVTTDGTVVTVLHTAVGGTGMPLRAYIESVENFAQVRQMRVGQSGTCYSSAWYVSALIAWSAIGTSLLVGLCVMLYKRCIGASRGGGVGRRRY